MPYWKDKTAIITGGSSGLGLAIARALAARGANVAIAARGAEGLDRAAALLSQSGGGVLPVRADVTSDDDVTAMVASALRRFGRLDVLVNAAGRSTRGLALDTTAAQFAQLADLNFGGVVRATQAAAPHLIAAGGHLVNIGSLASKLVSRYLGAYAATKFALAAYTAQLRLELAPQGVAVCLVCPGPIARDPSQRRYAEEASHLPPAAQKPGAGVRLRGMVAEKVAEKILTAARRRRAELVLPPAARLLSGCAAISPRLGDWIVRRMTGG